MKWALLVLVFSLSGEIDKAEITNTFVNHGKCIQMLKEKVEQAREIIKSMPRYGTSPAVHIRCVPYTGPWKQEVKYDG